MLKILLIALTFDALAEEAVLYKYDAKAARQQVTKSLEAYDRALYNECRIDVYRSIVTASRLGKDYTHVILRGCVGLEPEKLSKELIGKGYKVALGEIGIKGINYASVMTVSWR